MCDKMATYRFGNWNYTSCDCNARNPLQSKPDSIPIRYKVFFGRLPEILTVTWKVNMVS